MKHKTLEVLQEHDIRIPHFIVLNRPEDYTPTMAFILDNNKKYAVRSSFDTEDSGSHSFAGQFDTVLNVEKKDIPAAVQRVFNSVHNKNVAEYESAQNMNQNINGCVIIQEMVDAELSGVIFTVNPLGILNETIITVGEGLGYNVVQDKVATTSYFYNRDDDLYYCEQQENAPMLNNIMLRKLLMIANDIKKILKYEVDIEFAIKADHIFILQARPITTVSTNSPIILDNSNIVESYPGVSLPLTQDFVKSIYHEIFYNLILRISKNKKMVDKIDCHLQHMTDVSNWRIYYRISNWYAVLKLLPFSNKIIPMWQKMLGVENKDVSSPDDIKVPLKTKWVVFWSFLHYLINSPKYMYELNSEFDQKYPEYQNRIEAANDIDELIDVYNDIKWDILSDWDITLINDMYTFIYTALAGDKNKKMLADIKNLASMQPVYAIDLLVSTANDFGINSKEYRAVAESYIQEFGDRCLCELKLETKTYRTNPELLDTYVTKQQNSNGRSVKSDSFSDLQTGNWFIKKARVGIENREISRMNRSRIFGLSRWIFLKIGAKLVNGKQLEMAEDVFYLHMDELTSKTDMRKIVEQRKIEKSDFEALPAYSRLVFAEKIFNKQNTMTHCSVLNQDNKMHGIASSMGKVIGEVLIIDEPNYTIDTTGKILVTRSTDPGWVFLIQNAVGIIAEKGSLLSHTAIISRELHKPAIVNVKDCTKMLRNGDIVELDAETGFIKVVQRCNERSDRYGI